jgi:hypothetical protein
LNGVHDIGGMDGFGAIHLETDEPVFHELWESRVFGMFVTGAGLPPTPLDAVRHRLERLDPLRYLSSSYYERWLAVMEGALIEAGTLKLEEIEARVHQFAADPALPMLRRDDPARAEGLANVLRAGRPVIRQIRQKPRFAVGDKIVTRNLNRTATRACRAIRVASVSSSSLITEPTFFPTPTRTVSAKIRSISTRFASRCASCGAIMLSQMKAC